MGSVRWRLLFCIGVSITCVLCPGRCTAENANSLRLKATSNLGAPWHRAPGPAAVSGRLPDGILVKQIAVDPDTSWSHVKSEQGSGWIVDKYIDEVFDCGESLSVSDGPHCVISCWNLEHFHDEVERGIPENGRGGPIDPLRMGVYYERVPTIIEELGLKILDLSEIYAEEATIHNGADEFMDVGSMELGRQGQSTLSSVSGMDFEQKVLAPATAATFHGEAVAAEILLQQRQQREIQPRDTLLKMLVTDAEITFATGDVEVSMARVLDTSLRTHGPRTVLHPIDSVLTRNRFSVISLPSRRYVRTATPVEEIPFPSAESRPSCASRRGNRKSRLFAVLPNFFSDMPPRLDADNVSLHLLIDLIANAFVHGPLIACDGLDEVAVDNLCSDHRLRTPSINGNKCAREVYQPQQLGDLHHFVGLFVGRDLSQRQTKSRRPDAQHVQQPQAALAIVAPAKRLAVDEEDERIRAGSIRGRLLQRLHQASKTRLHCIPFEYHPDGPQAVLARDGAKAGLSATGRISSWSIRQSRPGPAPGSTTIMELVITPSSGSRRLISERGSSNSPNWMRVSSTATWNSPATVCPSCRFLGDSTHRTGSARLSHNTPNCHCPARVRAAPARVRFHPRLVCLCPSHAVKCNGDIYHLNSAVTAPANTLNRSIEADWHFLAYYSPKLGGRSRRPNHTSFSHS